MNLIGKIRYLEIELDKINEEKMELISSVRDTKSVIEKCQLLDKYNDLTKEALRLEEELQICQKEKDLYED